jgi:hypothetical protein
LRGCSNSTGQVRLCQLPKGERAWGPQAPGTRHSTPPLGFACMGCLPKLVLAFLDAMYPPLSFLRPPRPPRFESALRMESPTHKIDHPSSSLSVIMLTQSLPSFPSPSIPRSYSRSRVGVVTGDTSFAITGSPLLPSVFFCCSCPVRRRCCWLNPSLCRVLLSCC